MANQQKDQTHQNDSKDVEPATAPLITDQGLLSSIQKQRIKANSEAGVQNTPSPQPPVSPRPRVDDFDGIEVSPPDAADDPKADIIDPLPPNDAANAAAKPPSRGLRRFFGGYWRRKKWTLPLTIVAVLAVLGGVPYSRFLLAGLVIKQPFQVVVVDKTTGKPVTSADVSLDGKTSKTDSHGEAVIRDVKVGKRTLSVSKKYYQTDSQAILVPIHGAGKQQVSITATGRQVPITVTNKLTGKPLENATLKAAGAEVKTDKEGKASIVLPVDKPTLSVTLNASGFNSLEAKLLVTDLSVKENSYSLVSAGKVYFLSRLSGKIDVIKTDLDGGNRQTVVYGTGKEDDRGTVLLASRDWKYLALLSKRDSGQPKLYLIETDSDKMTTVDEGDASFNLVGWSDHQFIYGLTRNAVKEWEPNRQAVKSFNADKKQLLTLDQSQAEGSQTAYKSQYLENFYLINTKLVYSVRWFSYNGLGGSGASDKSHSIRESAVDSLSKKDVKLLPSDQYDPSQFKLSEPGSLYAVYYSRAESKYAFFEYENGAVKQVTDLDQNKFFSEVYPTYLASPSGKQAFWSEQRDGRDTFFVGDANGQNGKQVAALDEYQVYGWYSDDYLLMSKKSSELYIMPAAGGTALKVTDYHKPQLSYQGYGGGYGGL